MTRGRGANKARTSAALLADSGAVGLVTMATRVARDLPEIPRGADDLFRAMPLLGNHLTPSSVAKPYSADGPISGVQVNPVIPPVVDLGVDGQDQVRSP